jgi:hypothetical protein
MKPPWTLTGSMALLWSQRGTIMLVHYESSPVGPYDEWARGVLTGQGPRIVEMLVTSEHSRRGGRENWGFPKQLAHLHWQQRGKRIEFQSESRMYRFRACGPRFPLSAGGFCVQTLNGQDVRVPLKIKGQARLAWRGRQVALLVENFVFHVDWPEPIK